MTGYDVRLLAKIEELEARPVLDAYGKAALDVAYALLDRATSPDTHSTDPDGGEPVPYHCPKCGETVMSDVWDDHRIYECEPDTEAECTPWPWVCGLHLVQHPNPHHQPTEGDQ